MADTLHYDRKAAKLRYDSELFTQLVINGLSVSAARERVKEAIEYLERHELPFPEIRIG